MSTHQATVPPLAAAYFRRHPAFPTDERPVITATFRPGQAWKSTGHRKRVSRSWLRLLRAEGVEAVELTAGSISASFTVAELLRSR